MSEHAIMFVALAWIGACTAFTGYLAFRVWRKTDQIEGIIAATYLEARRALSQYRP